MRAAACFAAVAFGLAAAAPADTVTTTSGETLTGTVLEKNAEHVILKTTRGTRTIPMKTVKAIEASADAAPSPSAPDEPTAPPPKVTPVKVAPEEADEAFQKARSALVAGKWVEAAGLLEGLLVLNAKHLPPKKRLAATGALITCYLQIRDAHGAARAISRRAALATDENEKHRFLAAAEMLRHLGALKVGDKVLGRFEEVIETAMPWKAEQCLEQARKTARDASHLNDQAQLQKAADLALKQLDEADVYVPGYNTDQRRAEVLGLLIENILNGAREAVAYCEKVRPELTRTRLTSIRNKTLAMQWNSVARVYLGQRQAADKALRLIKGFTLRYRVTHLHEQHEAEIQELLAALDEYQYYPRGTGFRSSYLYPGTSERLKIRLRTFGGP